MKILTVVARKDYPNFQITKGQTHFVILRPFQPAQRSLIKPRRSTLVKSFWEKRLWALHEAFEAEAKDDMTEERIQRLLQRINSLFEICRGPSLARARSVITSWQIHIMDLWGTGEDDVDTEAVYFGILEALENLL